MRLIPASALLLTFVLSVCAGTPQTVIDRVVVFKHERKLALLSHGKEVRTYPVALGSDPVGPKRQRGDHRTPEGAYRLDSRNSRSQFYKAFHISYPNAQDIAAAKKLGVSPGGDILLHGLPREYAWVGKAHTLHDWTDGCIAW